MRLVRLLYVLAALVGLHLFAVVLYAIPVVSGVLDDAMEVRFSKADRSIVPDYGNGITPGQKETFYHLSQGSEILPWILLTAVDVSRSLLLQAIRREPRTLRPVARPGAR
jgi:hypothetical protein